MSMSDSKRSGSGNLQTASEMPESPLLGPELDIEQQPVGGEWLPNSGVGISEFGLFWFLLHAFCLRCSGYSTPDKPQTSRWRHFPWVANAMLWGFIAFELYLFIPFSLESARSIMDTSIVQAVSVIVLYGAFTGMTYISIPLGHLVLFLYLRGNSFQRFREGLPIVRSWSNRALGWLSLMTPFTLLGVLLLKPLQQFGDRDSSFINSNANTVIFIIVANVGYFVYGMFLLLTRLMRFKLEDMVRQIKSHAFSTPDAVLRRYIEIGKQIDSAGRDWRVFITGLLFSTLIFLIGVLIFVYLAAVFSSQLNGINLLIFLIMTVIQNLVLMYIIVYCMTMINDGHGDVRRAVVASMIFSHQERASLVMQMDLVPVVFQVYGVTLSTSLLRRGGLAVMGLFVPILLRAVLVVQQ